MKVELFSSKPLNKPVFASANIDKMNMLAQKLEAKNSVYAKKSKPVADIYNNSISFLKGVLNKDDYVDKLKNSLEQIYKAKDSLKVSRDKIKLSEKEKAFFENMFITFDNLENKNNITKEQLTNNLRILA